MSMMMFAMFLYVIGNETPQMTAPVYHAQSPRHETRNTKQARSKDVQKLNVSRSFVFGELESVSALPRCGLQYLPDIVVHGFLPRLRVLKAAGEVDQNNPLRPQFLRQSPSGIFPAVNVVDYQVHPFSAPLVY